MRKISIFSLSTIEKTQHFLALSYYNFFCNFKHFTNVTDLFLIYRRISFVM